MSEGGKMTNGSTKPTRLLSFGVICRYYYTMTKSEFSTGNPLEWIMHFEKPVLVSIHGKYEK